MFDYNTSQSSLYYQCIIVYVIKFMFIFKLCLYGAEKERKSKNNLFLKIINVS